MPLYGVTVPALARRLWVCHAHYRYWLLDSMRARVRAWQAERQAETSARVGAWLGRCSPLVRLELEQGLGPARRTIDWGARLRVAEVAA